MKLDKEQLKLLQNVCLELVTELDRICRKNKIEYSLGGGTLIGAVREHGFIPWDDDADIFFIREEYNKFVEACKKDLNGDKFYIQDHKIEPEYPWGYSKLRMKGTTLVQVGQENLTFRNGIFIDLFIYDNVPDGYLIRRIHYWKCYFIRKCQYAVVGRNNAKSIFMRSWFTLINKIPKKWLFSQLDKMALKYNSRQTELARHYTFPYFRKSCKYGLPNKCFKEYIDCEFEGKKFRIIRDYDIILTLKYGDYMTPPPPKDITYYPISKIEFPKIN